VALEFQPVFETDYSGALYTFARFTDAVTLTGYVPVRRRLAMDGLVAVPVSDPGMHRRHVQIQSLAGRPLSPTVAAFTAHLIERVQQPCRAALPARHPCVAESVLVRPTPPPYPADTARFPQPARISPMAPEETATMMRTDAIAHALHHFDSGAFRDVLTRRVALRTESQSPDSGAALRAYLTEEMAPAIDRLGGETVLVDNPVPGGGPFLIGHRHEDDALPTVLVYGHGDVVLGQPERWRPGLTPWQVAVEGDRWYGRGTADNKGQHTINLAALESVRAARGGRLGFNLKVLIETGEESGSPGLREMCAQRAGELAADVLLASDGPRLAAERPTVFLGARGQVAFTLSLDLRSGTYHSGNWGGLLRNPATVLANAIASLVDGSGVVRVPGLRAPEIPDAVRAALADVVPGGGPDDPDIDEDWGEPGRTAAEKLLGSNALEVLAFTAGTPDQPVNAIPATARAHCQLRFVVGTDWADLERIVREHLDAHGFPMVDVRVENTMAATRLDPDDPWVQWALASVERSIGRRPVVLPNLGGSLPNDVFADVIGMPTVWVPHSYPACGQHGPDEHLLGSVAREGLEIMAGLFWDLGEGRPSPR
jgi:acetylornithine deacetylase/succinyl-diaminopimelate desuccinylase-like protein